MAKWRNGKTAVDETDSGVLAADLARLAAFGRNVVEVRRLPGNDAPRTGCGAEGKMGLERQKNI